MSYVSTDFSDGIAHVTLRRPEKLNAISLDMLDAVIAAADEVRASEARCVILSGEGRAFCAGIDIASLSGLLGKDMDEVLIRRTHGDANRFQQFALAWRDLDIPVVVAIHGACFGAGLQLALGADMRVASPDARLSVMEMKWGLVPDMGGMVFLPKLIGSDVLRRLTYTAEIIEAHQALAWGLLTEIADDPLARAIELAHVIASQSPSAIRAAKRLIAIAETASDAEVLMAESDEQASLIGTPDQMAAIQRGMVKPK